MEIVESIKVDNVNKFIKFYLIIFKNLFKNEFINIDFFEKFFDLYIFYNFFIFINIINIL